MTARRHGILRKLVTICSIVLATFVIFAYFVLPLLWKHFEHEPALANLSMRTETAQHIPGDPLNIGLVVSKDDLIAAFQQIGWLAADTLSLKSDLEIADSVILDRAYRNAPVSTLYFQGRAQDFAFEKPVGISADQRHHVRLWQVVDKGSAGQPVWLGSVSFDKGVGFSRFTGQITHHIDANVDAARDGLIKALVDARIVSRLYDVSGIGPTLTGRNGEGDAFFTDGELTVAELRPGAIPDASAPEILASPPLIRLKQSLWSVFAVGPDQ